MNVMSMEDILSKVTQICKKNQIRHLKLIGSFANGTATQRSDIDFVAYGCENIFVLEDEISEIDTLRKIDILDYDSIKDKYLLEDIERYGKQIY
ncbi:MAG: nucleotidyltransferase domain-containing protein [Bacteroides sp.]|nr:nucleotidyltransferase domain-containing protein [Bacteroides sp.]MCM1549819.1 nucleotidyltransferase domain-containing protein [Clostridium sp.]